MPSLLGASYRRLAAVELSWEDHVAIMAAALSDDSKRYISKAEEICNATARLGGFDKQTSGATTARSSGSTRSENLGKPDPSTHGRGRPESPQNSQLHSSLQLTVYGSDAKTDWLDRFADVKSAIYDLSKRQLGDLVDEPTSAVEDVNMLLDEMRNALRSMETVVVLETAMIESQPP